MEKLKIPYPVIVEGKYDRLRLLTVADANILTTDGFGIFKERDKAALLRALAQKTPIIVLTDSDGAGALIRSKIKGTVPKDRLIHLYIPKIKGKEKRKKAPSAENALGVEGMEKELLYDLLLPFSDGGKSELPENRLSALDFYDFGLYGGKDSSAKRDRLAQYFGLPPKMTCRALTEALKIVCTYEDFLDYAEKYLK